LPLASLSKVQDAPPLSGDTGGASRTGTAHWLPRFVVRRAGTALLQGLAAVVLVFVVLRLLPADPATQFAGTSNPSPAELAATRHRLGLDESMLAQLGHFLSGLAHGDLGTSWAAGTPVGGEIAKAFPVTIQVVVLAFALTLLLAIPLGLLAASRPGSRLDAVVRVYSLFAGSQPEFWWGLLFVFVGWYKLGLFPSPLGVLSLAQTPPPDVTHFVLIDALLAGDVSAWSDALQHFALPIVTLTFALSGPFLKLVRESARKVAGSEFMVFARATGMPRPLLMRGLLRNSLTPVITLVGIFFASALGGSVIIETVFSLDGIGRYTLTSTQALDFPALQGAVVVLTACALSVYVGVDVLYALVDPRVRYGRTAA